MYDVIKKSFKNCDQDLELILSKPVEVTITDEYVAIWRSSEFDDNGEVSYSGAHIFLETIEARKLRDFLNFALQD